MGLDISVYLIIGVPITELGSIETEHEIVKLHDALGKETGKTSKISRCYLVTKEERFLLGSDRDSIGETIYRRRMRLSFPDFLEEEQENWIHSSDYESEDLSQILIGLIPTAAFLGPRLGRSGTYKGFTAQEIQNCTEKVRTLLKSRFGYEGEIYVLSQAHYSY